MVRGEGGINGPDLSFIGSQRPIEFSDNPLYEPNAHVSREFWLVDVVLERRVSEQRLCDEQDTYYLQMLTRDKGLVTLPRKDFRKLEIRKTR